MSLHRRLLFLVLGLAWIWALFLPRWTAERVTLDARPPVVLFALLMLLAVLAVVQRRPDAATRWIAALAILVLALLQFAAAAVAQILDRPLDLYFDLRHVPNLLALYRQAAGWRGAFVLVGAALLAAAALGLTSRAVAAIGRAMAERSLARTSLVIAALGLLAALLPGEPVDATAAREAWTQAGEAARAFAVLHGFDRRYAAALAAPQPALGPLPGLKGKDVYLVFVESYGTVALDDGGYRQTLQPALDDFATSVAGAGYHLLSSRLVSPVYGGGSWLAHGTLASGLKLDPLLNVLLLDSTRLALPRYLAASGYRTIEVMPGIKAPDPEAAFWGFERHYFAKELGYAGPEFGWFDIPDQFTLAQFSARELTPHHAPLFAQLVLVSSHTPFAPVPPYLADWRDAGDFNTVPMAAWSRIYAPPDWNDLDQPYLASIAYDLKTLGAWMARLDDDALVVILGDHQPPELTRGAGQPWTVPIYVLSRDEDLVAPFAALGYAPGAAPPPRAQPEGMENFLGEFLKRFGTTPVAARLQTPPAPAVSLP